ncbi:LysR substrate-binding domain-containing protein [Mangrovicoccus algicola]|uniref:LysR family transcriptional regulator n=1 Tax=Mangrovicoccus algicola TaxID=2771008 RepID=A0A8J7CIN7_9RHOB|nr:LysR substrate-binding domain-containing protein [Mangrovicoccus algicola]MBE3639810.1 LysR family transcriptional regulator [Mangrovicoccus algicola]
MAGHTFELSQLRYFVAVAEELNFRRAAKRLNMTQPPLSRHIALLEHTLGTPLFDRTNRSVRLTAAGKRLLIDASDILTRAESAVLAAQQAARGKAGAVELGFVPSACIEVVPRIARRLAELMPEVTLTLREVMTVEGIESLGAGSLDFGIIRLHPRGQGLPIEKLWSEPFLLAAPVGHPLLAQKDFALSDLNGVDFVGYSSERGGFLREVVQGYLKAHGVTPNEVFAVAQRHTVLSLVDAGFGVALVPGSSVQIGLPGVAFRDIGLPADELHSDLYLAMRPKPPEPLVAAVAGIIRAEFRGQTLPAAKP